MSLEEKLEHLKQQELLIAAKREAVEKRLTDQARKEGEPQNSEKIVR